MKLYTSVPVPKFPSNTFPLSRPVQGSMTFQKNYPVEVLEVIPGDGFVFGSETFARLEPMVAPVMARMDMDQHAFFCPAWQLNNHFDDFITGGEKMDFTEHMPWCKVSELYGLVDALLDAAYLPDEWFNDLEHTDTNFQSQYIAQARYEINYRIDLALRILENCDWLRAVPFTKPDFIQISQSMTPEVMLDSYAANEQAFSNANGDLRDNECRVNIQPFTASFKVWCEFFRDENLVPDYWDRLNSADTVLFSVNNASLLDLLDEVMFLTAYRLELRKGLIGLSLDEATFGVRMDFYQELELFALQRRAWRKDRYTGALPFTQKGPDVMVPLQGVFDVQNSGPVSGSIDVWFNGTKQAFTAANGSEESRIRQNVDLSQNNGQGTTIRELRRAFYAEEFAEADGRFGNRYPENTLGQFGVYTPDARLPRCQFLGSRTQPIVVSEVVQNSETGTTPQGNLAGKGTSYGSGRVFRGRFTQHGFIIVLASIRVAATYEQGIHPMFSRYDRTDYAWPRFARLGEEPIYLKELSLGSSTDPTSEDEVFAYAPRYSSYKSDQGSVHGLLKGSRNYWTFSRRFAGKPLFNEEFIYNPPRLSPFAVVNPLEDQFTVQMNLYVKANRKLPYWGTPVL